MSECPRCGPAKLRGGPRLLVIGMPKGFVDPLGSKPVTAKAVPVDQYCGISGDDGEESVDDWPKIIQ